jgi:hypothetical protein
MYRSPPRRARVDLDPQDVEGRDGPGHLQEPLGLEVEVQVDQDVDVEPGALAERRELVAGGGEDVAVGIELGEALAAREPRVVQAGVVAQQHHVGLERRVAAAHDLPPEASHVVQGPQGREPQLLPPADPVRAAV